MCGEDPVLQRLGGHPPDRKQALPSFTVVVGLIDVSCHPEVCKKNTKDTFKERRNICPKSFDSTDSVHSQWEKLQPQEPEKMNNIFHQLNFDRNHELISHLQHDE